MKFTESATAIQNSMDLKEVNFEEVVYYLQHMQTKIGSCLKIAIAECLNTRNEKLLTECAEILIESGELKLVDMVGVMKIYQCSNSMFLYNKAVSTFGRTTFKKPEISEWLQNPKRNPK